MAEDLKLIGEAIRLSRKAKKITLVELSRLTGVAQATLSRIETGVMQGTIDSHKKIAEALGVSLAELYSGIDTRKQNIDNESQSARSSANYLSEKVRCEILTPSAPHKKMFPMHIRFEPKGEVTLEPLERGVDKFIYCLTGKIQIVVENDSYELQEGDSLYFDASLPHQFTNLAERESRLIVVTSPSTL